MSCLNLIQLIQELAIAMGLNQILKDKRPLYKTARTYSRSSNKNQSFKNEETVYFENIEELHRYII